MFSSIIAWLFGTKTGRTVLLCGAIAAGAVASWYAFSSHYDAQGYARCQGEHAAALNKANVEQARENAERAKTGSQIGQKAADNAQDVVRDADTAATTTKKDIHDVYKKPPVTAPVALGSCVHPVDPRVQKRIDSAIREANRSGGSL
jgi:sRNA-binding protein